MATANHYCTFILLLYLQGNYAQQGLSNNQNGINNVIGFQQQQAVQRTNTPNNINQMPNGGLNINLQQPSNMQQANLQQPISANLQGNLQQSLSPPANLQTPGASGSVANVQYTQQGFTQLPHGLVVGNPSKLQAISAQFNNGGVRQNAQFTQQQSMNPVSNVSPAQTQCAPLSSNSLAEVAAVKGHPSLLSLFASQNAAQPQQNQQMSIANFNPAQNQLTDAQKQFLVRALQSQSSGQNQFAANVVQTQMRATGGNNQPAIVVQSQPVPPQQPQAIVTPISNNQPPYITVQAQPLTTYLQNQQPQVEEPSVLSLILSELQPSDSQYTAYPPYPVQNKGSKSNLKSLIPLIINLLKEKNGCGCQNCGCPNNGCGQNKMPEPNLVNPFIFTGYSNQKNYSQAIEESSKKANEVEEAKNKGNSKDRKNLKKNTVNVDSEEVSEENDSEYIDDSEGD